jgi:hypothetical protein
VKHHFHRVYLATVALSLLLAGAVPASAATCGQLTVDLFPTVTSSQGSTESGTLLGTAKLDFFTNLGDVFGTFQNKVTQGGRRIEGTIFLHFPSLSPGTTLTVTHTQVQVPGTAGTYIGTFVITGGTGEFAGAGTIGDALIGTIPTPGNPTVVTLQAQTFCYNPPQQQP